MPVLNLPLTLGYTVALAPSFVGLRAALLSLGLDRCIVVTNPTVRGLHGEALAGELGEVARGWHEIPDGEAYKSLTTWSKLISELLSSRMERSTAILAFGGGVVGDLAGFAAATVLRGVPLVQVPTTLLAMVDASVGGKTAVNVPEGKNLVGAFHQPRLVWAALDTLGTLPEREWRCGLGEIVKHTIIEGEVALAQLERCAARLSRREDVLDVVAASVHTKARIVESDPHEKGHRALLNLGHTLGHAIETTAGYGVVSHGEAVSLGLLAVVRLAASRCDVDAVFVERLVRLYVQLGLPTRLPAGLDPAALLRAMTFDKKRERGMVKLVYVKAAGIVELRPVGDDVLAELPRLVST